MAKTQTRAKRRTNFAEKANNRLDVKALTTQATRDARWSQRDGFWNYFLTDVNPSSDLMGYTAKRSESMSHDYVFLLDRAFYDALDEMERDDLTIAGTYNLIVSNILRRDITFDAEDGEDETQLMWRDHIEAALSTQISDIIASCIRNAMHHGFSMHEIIWERGRDLAWQPGKVLHRHPGLFNFSPDGDGVYMISIGEGMKMSPQPAPLYKFIKTTIPARYANPMGDSMTARVYPYFWLKKNALKAGADYLERFGMPASIVKLDPMIEDYEREMIAIKSALEALKRESGIVLKPGINIDWMDRAGGRGEPPHFAMFKLCDVAILTFLLGSSLGVREAEFGTRAQAEVHQEVQDIRTKPLAKIVEDAINRDVIDPILVLNFGEEARGTVRLRIDTEDGVNFENAVKALESAVNNLGLRVPEQQAYEWLGIRQPSKDERVLAPKQKTLAPGLPFEDEEEELAAPHVIFSEINTAIEAQYLMKVEELGKQLGQLAWPGMKRALKKYLSDYKNSMGVNTVANYKPTKQVERGIRAAAVLALASSSLHFRRYLAPEAGTRILFDDFENDLRAIASPEYRDAVRWMVDRDIMSRAEVKNIVSGLRGIEQVMPANQLEQIVRQRVFALKDSIDSQVSKIIKDAVTNALNEGKTLATVIDELAPLIDSGSIPGAESYIQTVFRTETSNAYNQQRKVVSELPGVSSHLWGYEVITAEDEAVRPTHAALHGKKFRKGSPAFVALGSPPFSFNCRCILSPIVVPDISNPGVEESPDALSLAQRVERFCEH